MRVVRDLKTKDTTSAARTVTDSYARPSYFNDTRLTSVADALNKWNTYYTSYRKKKEQEQYNKEVAEGYALAQKYADKDYRTADFARIVSRGAEPIRKLTQRHRYGINVFQMAQGMNVMEARMNDWYEKAYYIDDEGNTKRIAEISDPVVFDKAFATAYTREWQKYSRGQYDPKLFKEAYERSAGALRNQLFSKYLSQMRQEKVRQLDESGSAWLDSYMQKTLYDNDRLMFTNPDKAANLLAGAMEEAINVHAMASSTNDAVDNFTRWVVSNVSNPNLSKQEIAVFRDAASRVSRIKNDNQKWKSILDNARQAEQQIDWNARNQREEQRIAKMMQEEDTLNQILKEHNGALNLDFSVLGDKRVVGNANLTRHLSSLLSLGQRSVKAREDSVFTALINGDISASEFQQMAAQGQVSPENFSKGLELINKLDKTPSVRNNINMRVKTFLDEAVKSYGVSNVTADYAKKFYTTQIWNRTLKTLKVNPNDNNAINALDFTSPQIEDAINENALAVFREIPPERMEELAMLNASSERGYECSNDVISIKDASRTLAEISRLDVRFQQLYQEWETYCSANPEMYHYALMGSTPMDDSISLNLAGILANGNITTADGQQIKTIPMVYELFRAVYEAKEAKKKTNKKEREK